MEHLSRVIPGVDALCPVELRIEQGYHRSIACKELSIVSMIESISVFNDSINNVNYLATINAEMPKCAFFFIPITRVMLGGWVGGYRPASRKCWWSL